MNDGRFPTYDVLFQPTIDALRAHVGDVSNEEIRIHVIRNLGLPPEVTERSHKGRPDLTELEYRLMWSRTYLRKFGLIDSLRRGFWILTQMGRDAQVLDRREIILAVRGSIESARDANLKSRTPFGDEMSPEAESSVISDNSTLRSPTPLLPTYSQARFFLRAVEQVTTAAFFSMSNAIVEQSGNPQAQVDWSRPDEWIPERLESADRELALHIWRLSKGELNPRHTRGPWYFVSKHGLLTRNQDDSLQVSERGRSFLEETQGPVIAAIDEYEGLLIILRLVAEQGAARRSTLLPPYTDYCRTQTTFQSENVTKSSLYYRLRNLVDRGLVSARGISYAMTDEGLSYLGIHAATSPVQVPDELAKKDKSAELLRLADDMRKDVRSQLHNYLFEMNAYQFEKLIQLLLEEMGYENVYTTSPTNDKGVDVLGTIKMGISSVLEVIQVKRHRGSIGRPILDQLRGSLHRFDAMRGTIITTGGFSKGAKDAAFERGAPPITLIDGDTLLDLLMDREIGVHRRPVAYFEFAPEKLVRFEIDAD